MAEIYKPQTLMSSNGKNFYPLTDETQVIMEDGTRLNATIDNIQSNLTEALNTANSAKNMVDTAMPKSGGTFTGNVSATATNRNGAPLRNIAVKTASAGVDGATVSTDMIIMVRK